jgi:hypothetical protein
MFQAAIRSTTAPTIQWSQLAPLSGTKPRAQGAANVHAPRISAIHSWLASNYPTADSMTKKRMAPMTQAFHAAWLAITTELSACGPAALCAAAPPPNDITQGEINNQIASATKIQSYTRFSSNNRLVAWRIDTVAIPRSPFYDDRVVGKPTFTETNQWTRAPVHGIRRAAASR